MLRVILAENSILTACIYRSVLTGILCVNIRIYRSSVRILRERNLQ